jgi:hypothetical protein
VKKTKAVSKINRKGDSIIRMPAARIGALSGVPSGLMYGISNQLLTNPMIKATTKKAPDAAIEARRNLRFVPWTMRPSVRGHRADEMKDATANAASEAPSGPRC